MQRAPIPRRRNAGLTLLEVAMVLVVLCILASLGLAQYRGVEDKAREAALRQNLAILRSAIGLYQVQHDGAFPNQDVSRQLKSTTDVAGAPGVGCGPYLRPSALMNPVDWRVTIHVVASMPAAATGQGGWIYATRSGDIQANVRGAGPSGTDYFHL